MPEALQARLAARLAQSFPDLAARHLCVGFSGGLDSTVLLHALAALRAALGFRLSAVHVHHGLNPAADQWAEHCRAVAGQWVIPFELQRVSVANDGGEGLEAAARHARHAVFQRVEADVVVLAHHRDDQAETVLHHLLRGAGVAGAAGMAAYDPARRVLRPLLDEPRAVLEDYASRLGLHWIEDDSNADTQFTRNYFRHQVLPVLAQRFPAASANLARAAGHFREAAELLEGLAREDWAALQVAASGARSALRQLSPARARNLLRGVLAEQGVVMPSASRLEEVLRQLCGNSPVRIALGACCVCAWREAVWLEPAEQPPLAEQIWQGQQRLPWGDDWVALEPVRAAGGLRLQPGARLATWQPGMRLRLVAGGPSRSFRGLCQEHQIPPWQRARLPVLWQDGRPIWIGGLGASADAACAPDEAGWHIIWPAQG